MWIDEGKVVKEISTGFDVDIVELLDLLVVRVAVLWY